jgi:peroxiredoxin
MHLSELRHVIPQIKQAGFDVLFLSNDRPDQLYASLKRETQDDIAGLDYMILSDADLDAARALGTAFMIPDNLIGYLDEKGRDYQDSSIAKYRALAVPAVVLVDASGEIRFIYANPNDKIRLSAEELKAAADELLANMPK